MRRQSRRLKWAVAGLLTVVSVGCTSPREARIGIEDIDITWVTQVPEGSLNEMTKYIRDLSKLQPGGAEAVLSIPLLAQQAYRNESAWVRAESLRAAWKLADEIPVLPLMISQEPASVFNEWMYGFEELDTQTEAPPGEEVRRLAELIASYRFPPDKTRYAIQLAGVIAHRGMDREPGPVQQVFAGLAPEACRHALCLVTLLAGDDDTAYVREEALIATRYLDLETALHRMVATLTSESDQSVLLAMLGTAEFLAHRYGVEPLAEILDFASQSADGAVRRRAVRILEEFQA